MRNPRIKYVLCPDWVPSERANDLRWQRMRAWAVQHLEQKA